MPTNGRRSRTLQEAIPESLVRRTAREHATGWGISTIPISAGDSRGFQLESSLHALEVQITDEDTAQIDTWVSPGTSAL
jgi:hypothetical protein